LAATNPALMMVSPYFRDGYLLEICLLNFVSRYIDSTCTERDLDEFSETLRTVSGGIFCPSVHGDIVHFLANHILIGTFQHEVIGNSIGDIQCDPRETSTKLRGISTDGRNLSVEEMIPDRDTWVNQMTPLLLGTTMRHVMRLTDDISSYYATLDTSKPGSVGRRESIYDQLQTDLCVVGKTIDRRNKQRSTPFLGAHPQYLEMGLSQ